MAGFGHYALPYVRPALTRARRSRLGALVSGNAEKGRSVAARYGVAEKAVYTYASMARLADDDAISVVYVVTPNSSHAELTVKAFESGKHVLCEKLMANTPAECQRMIDAAKAAGRRLMIAYRAHWKPHNVQAKAMLDADELGQCGSHRPTITVRSIPRYPATSGGSERGRPAAARSSTSASTR